MVCKCTKTCEDKVTRCLDNGSRDWIDVSQMTGAGRYCGSCIGTLRKLVARKKQSAKAA
ncbi:MAG: (2Fe-2S)-binding protein [Myxococcota bacterium]